jgi:hypothetical protein
MLDLCADATDRARSLYPRLAAGEPPITRRPACDHKRLLRAPNACG